MLPPSVSSTAARPGSAARHAAMLAAVFTAIGVSMPFLPPFLAAKGLGAEAVAAVLFAGSVTRLLVAPPLGRLADRLGDARPLLCAAAAAAAALALLWLPAAGVAALLLLQVGYSLCTGPLAPLAEALTLSAARRGLLDYGRVRAAGSAAFIAGAVGVGVLTRAVGLWAVPVALCGCLLAAAVAARHLPPPQPHPPSEAATPGNWLALLRLPRLRRVMLLGALLNGSHAAYYAFGSIHWAGAGHDATTIGLLWAWGVVAEVALFYVGRQAMLRLGPRGLMLLSGLAGVLRWTVMAGTTELVALVAAQSLHALTFGAQHLAAMHVLTHAVPSNRQGLAQALYSSLGSGAALAGLTLLSGPLYAQFGGGAFLAMAAASAAALPVALGLRRGENRRRRGEGFPPERCRALLSLPGRRSTACAAPWRFPTPTLSSSALPNGSRRSPP